MITTDIKKMKEQNSSFYLRDSDVSISKNGSKRISLGNELDENKIRSEKKSIRKESELKHEDSMPSIIHVCIDLADKLELAL